MDQQWLNTYREEIGGFSNTIHSFAQGEIARKDYKGISGGFGSYAQRDAAKHMLRLRLPGGRVTPERLHFMAQAVQQYHVPFLKLTTCEAIQMHDLTPDEVPAIMEAAIPCGIITRGGGGDNPRNIQVQSLPHRKFSISMPNAGILKYSSEAVSRNSPSTSASVARNKALRGCG